MICYEIIFSGALTKNEDNYDFILNISEDGWFGNSIGPVQHFSHSIFRSIEEGKDILRVANNGISAHISSNGKVNKMLDDLEAGDGFWDRTSATLNAMADQIDAASGLSTK